MVRPTPRAFPSGRTVVFAGFVPIYSGGTARDLHPLPLPQRHNGRHSRRGRQNLSSPLMFLTGSSTDSCLEGPHEMAVEYTNISRLYGHKPCSLPR